MTDSGTLPSDRRSTNRGSPSIPSVRPTPQSASFLFSGELTSVVDGHRVPTSHRSSRVVMGRQNGTGGGVGRTGGSGLSKRVVL